VLVVLLDMAKNLRPVLSDSAGNIWGAGTLEWLPNHAFAARSIPHVRSREPLWDQPGLDAEVDAGRYYLPAAPRGRRETIITSPIEATPQYLLCLPGPGWTPLLAALFTAAFFLLLTVKLTTLALACGVIATAMVFVWMWGSDPAPIAPVDIGGGIRLPTYVSGPVSHSWWAMVVLLLVAGSLYLAYVFSYLYVWTVAPQGWSDGGGGAMPATSWPIASGVLLLTSSGCILAVGRTLSDRAAHRLFALVAGALIALAAALALEAAGLWRAGLRPDAGAYGALAYMASFLQLQVVLPLAGMSAFVVARRLAGRLDAVRRVAYDNLVLLWHYAVGQGVLSLLLVHGFPRLVG
jgi:cytochrome c oxidase subunit I+III